MDPDAERSFKSYSFWMKAALLTLALSGVYYYERQSGFPVLRRLKSVAKKDVATSTKAAGHTAQKEEKKKKKKIYLTFDDGPNKGSEKVMQILEEEKIPATMFIVGEHISGSKFQKQLYDSLLSKSFIEIANHSFSHAGNQFSSFYSNPQKVVEDFKRCGDSLKLVTNIARTPGRNIWRTDSTSATDLKASKAAADSLYEHGFQLAGWDLEWHFTNSQTLVQTKEQLVAQIDSLLSQEKTKSKDNLVLLTHDRTFLRSNDSAELHGFIKLMKGRSDSMEFDFMKNYPGISKPN